MKAKVKQAVRRCHQRSCPIGLATGVFDLLHSGHLDFLRKARQRMDRVEGCLFVGIESDRRVKNIKGEGRPIESEEERMTKLDNARIADLVFVLPENFDNPEDHLSLIQQIKPEVLLVSEHTPHLDKKKEIMSKIGGKVEVVCDLDPRFSTSKTIKREALVNNF